MNSLEFKDLVAAAREMPGGQFELVLRTTDKAAGNVPTSPVSHAKDFASLLVGGVNYTFTPKQRKMVAELYRAYRQGHCWVTTATLLDAAESYGGSVWETFRGNPAWGAIIKTSRDEDAPPGCYRLELDP